MLRANQVELKEVRVDDDIVCKVFVNDSDNLMFVCFGEALEGAFFYNVAKVWRLLADARLDSGSCAHRDSILRISGSVALQSSAVWHPKSVERTQGSADVSWTPGLHCLIGYVNSAVRLLCGQEATDSIRKTSFARRALWVIAVDATDTWGR